MLKRRQFKINIFNLISSFKHKEMYQLKILSVYKQKHRQKHRTSDIE